MLLTKFFSKKCTFYQILPLGRSYKLISCSYPKKTTIQKKKKKSNTLLSLSLSLYATPHSLSLSFFWNLFFCAQLWNNIFLFGGKSHKNNFSFQSHPLYIISCNNFVTISPYKFLPIYKQSLKARKTYLRHIEKK